MKMDFPDFNTDLSQEFVEKILRDFSSRDGSGKRKEISAAQPEIVNNIFNKGVAKSATGLAAKIDHTLLKPEATPDEIRTLCEEAKKYKFASVCINPCYVALCSELLKGTEVKVCTVISFPLGAATTEVKKYEAEQAINNGAAEIDMVINVGQLKSGNYDYVYDDISRVVQTAHKYQVMCKVILETALLNDQEKVKACIICKKSGADFVKTSTGFSKGGATVNDVALMKYIVGSGMGVKASGGIRSREDAEAMIANGADRIGASASVKIVMGEKSEGNY